MADNSNIVIHWEIDNATAAFATGSVESEVFNEGGFKWIAAIERRALTSKTNFSLRCVSDQSRRWKCETEVEVCGIHYKTGAVDWIKGPFSFNENASHLLHISDMNWDNLSNPMYRYFDKVTIEIRINIISSARLESMTDFSSLNRMSNVILKIGENKLHVSKEFLAVHSSVFETLFFGDCAEKGKEEVEIKDVVYEEFRDLIHLIYLENTKITDCTVLYILKLADKFQMKRVLDMVSEHLTQSNRFNAAKKLLLADKFSFVSLRDHCLTSFTSFNDVKDALMASFVKYSDDMKARICERMMQLNPQMADNPSLILLWEIDDAAARFATGKVQSEAFNEGGFRWSFAFEKDSGNFILKCEPMHCKGPWKCVADLSMFILRDDGDYGRLFKDRISLNEENSRWINHCPFYWENMAYSRYRINNRNTLEFRINMIKDEPIDISTKFAAPYNFAAPNNRSDVVLNFDKKKLYVSKQWLAIHSPIFDTLFFGDFGQKKVEEVNVQNVVYEEFIDLLHLIYVGTVGIKDDNVMHILKLADQFQMEGVRNLAKRHLIRSNGFNAAKKLLLADQYRLVPLRAHCLESFNSVAHLTGEINTAPEFVDYSDDTKAAICERVMKLSLQNLNASLPMG